MRGEPWDGGWEAEERKDAERDELETRLPRSVDGWWPGAPAPEDRPTREDEA